MRIADRLLAQLPPDEHQVHPRVERAGAEQRVRGDQVVEPVALHVAERLGGERRLELEDPRGAALAQQLVDRRVLEIERVHVEVTAVPLRTISTASWITVSVLRPSMSILSMPTFSSGPISNWVMMASSPSAVWPAPLVGAVQTGTYSRERARGDHHAGGVHRGVAADALDPAGQLHAALVLRTARDQLPELGHLASARLRRSARRPGRRG